MKRSLIFLTLCFAVLNGLPRQAEASDTYREEVLACEEAVSYLKSACPNFDATKLRCIYYEQSGCGYREWTRPALSVSEVNCILSTSEAALVSTGICERAQRAQAESGSEDTTSGAGTTTTPKLPVCQ